METNRQNKPLTNKYQNYPDNFNKYFLSIADKITNDVRYKNRESCKTLKSPTHYLAKLFHKPFPNIQCHNTSTKEIEKIIKSLNLKKSYGYDEISTEILKISAPFISSPLTYICNRSILYGIFPTRLKYSLIKPIYKKGDRENAANYRPISLLTAFSKVFEKIIYNRLIQHIETNNILRDAQFGFRTFSSTEKASYKLINGILNALNNRMVVGGIFWDLQKAFHCVNHNILLTKLKYYGITGTTHKLIKCYLKDRYQRVILQNNSPDSRSKWGKIKYGVPQGSILGLLLFLLYINDLSQITHENSKVILYADDTSIIITSPNPSNYENIVIKIFEDINRWFNSNLLSLNLEKTHYMQFRNKNSAPIDLNIGHENKNITKTSSTKFLGLTLENTLSWKIHIDTIITKLSSATFAIRTLKPFLSQDSLRMMYYLYFHSIMTYGLIFWGNSHYSNTIFRMQKRAIRVIMGLKKQRLL